jgi:hypothetical protein
MPVLSKRAYRQTGTFDRDALHFPGQVVETYDLSPDQILRPLFDMLWNAAGQRFSDIYDAEGNLKPFVEQELTEQWG